jgi:hypothetical protein
VVVKVMDTISLSLSPSAEGVAVVDMPMGTFFTSFPLLVKSPKTDAEVCVWSIPQKSTYKGLFLSLWCYWKMWKLLRDGA